MSEPADLKTLAKKIIANVVLPIDLPRRARDQGSGSAESYLAQVTLPEQNTFPITKAASPSSPTAWDMDTMNGSIFLANDLAREMNRLRTRAGLTENQLNFTAKLTEAGENDSIIVTTDREAWMTLRTSLNLPQDRDPTLRSPPRCR